MSLRLLLEDYLALMREEGELDVFLPTLLSAMGHEIIYRAQKGTRQYGADIVSVGKDDDNERKLYVWLVKCGDITRSNWSTNEQSVRQSIEDVGDIYLLSHVAPQHKNLPKKLVILTNGDIKASLTHTLSAYLTQWTERHQTEAATVNGSILAGWTEQYLLDENVLPLENRTLFRRMLATVESTEVCVSTGQELIDNIVKSGLQIEKSAARLRKNQLNALRAIRTTLSVLLVWARNAKNLQAAYKLAMYAVLAVWSAFHAEMAKKQNKEISTEYSHVLFQLLQIAEAYHAKVERYYLVQNAFALALPDNLLVTERVFEEIGRLGFLACIWALYGAIDEASSEFAVHLAHINASRIIAILRSHTCSQSPSHDHHAIDIHVALLALMMTKRDLDAHDWLAKLVGRLRDVALFNRRYWPMTADFQEMLAIRHGNSPVADEFLNTSTLLPILAIWAAALKREDVYSVIKDDILPAVPQASLNVWNSDAGYDDSLANPVKLHEHGVAEAFKSLPESSKKFLTQMLEPLPTIEPMEKSSWYSARCPYIPMLASVCWRLQLPREMVAKQVKALADASPLKPSS